MFKVSQNVPQHYHLCNDDVTVGSPVTNQAFRYEQFKQVKLVYSIQFIHLYFLRSILMNLRGYSISGITKETIMSYL